MGSKTPTQADDGWNASWDDEENWKSGGSMSEYSAPSMDDVASQKTAATSELLAELEDMQRKYEQLQADKATLIEEKSRLVDSVQRERHQNLAAISEVDSLKHEAGITSTLLFYSSINFTLNSLAFFSRPRPRRRSK